MRLVIDMQGSQTPFSRHRGVGRYTLELSKAIARTRGSNEVVIALNGAFPETIDPIRRAFSDILPASCIRVWQQFYDSSASQRENQARQRAAEISREIFLESINPDVIFVPNLQEGYFDPAATSVGHIKGHAITCTTLHDVTPLKYPEKYLRNQDIHIWYDEKIKFVRSADLISTVSEYSRQQIMKYMGIDGKNIIVVPNAVDHNFFRPPEYDNDYNRIHKIKHDLGIGNRFILYVGGADEHKNIDTLITAYINLYKKIDIKVKLLLVGKEIVSEIDSIKYKLKKFDIDNDVIIPGYVRDVDVVSLYQACDVFVFPSYEEGFGLPVLEAMACGAPVLASNAASLPEIIGSTEALFEAFDADGISEKIKAVLTDPEFRQKLCENGVSRAAQYSWEKNATFFWNNLLDINRKKISDCSIDIKEKNKNPLKQTIDKIANLELSASLSVDDIKNIAQSLVETYPTSCTSSVRTIYLDVSALRVNGDRTGIQRVVRAICAELVLGADPTVEAIPVYTAVDDFGFRRAGFLLDQIRGQETGTTSDEYVEIVSGDVLLFLDLHPGIAISHVALTRYLRGKGVIVAHVVYDLLPVALPKYFWPSLCDEFERWLRAIIEADAAICISKSVASELQKWIDENEIAPSHDYKISWFHLGSDIQRALPNEGLPVEADAILEKIQQRCTFLSVGTLEPRKGYALLLSAFDILWGCGHDLNLVIVGKAGWATTELSKRIETHPQLGSHLFYMNQISDEYLERVYGESECLIAASEGEGFGLPLVEAASRGLDLIVRDIPVFREVAGTGAFYFPEDSSAELLAERIMKWITLKESGMAPSSTKIRVLSWRESARQLLATLV